MTAYLLALHLFALALPAAAVAALMVTGAGKMPGWRGRRPLLGTWWSRWWLTFGLNLAVVATGLLMSGVDGKISTYMALLLVSALTQFVLWRGWRA